MRQGGLGLSVPIPSSIVKARRRAGLLLLATAVLTIAGLLALFAIEYTRATQVPGLANGAGPVPIIRPNRSTSPTATATRTATPSPTPSPTEAIGPDGRATPYWTTIIQGDFRDRTGAASLANGLRAAGHTPLLFPSDTYSSLSPGYWVVAIGNYGSASSAADASARRFRADGYGKAYPRCLGSAAACA